MIRTHLKVAVNSLRGNKMRTILTLLGIIIGVTSVTTIIGMGEGVKQQVGQQISRSGNDIISIIPKGHLRSGLSLQQSLGSSQSNAISLSQDDMDDISNIDNVASTSGATYLSGSIKKDRFSINSEIIGVSENYFKVTGTKLQSGQIFGENISNSKTVILGQRTAEKLFNTANPIGSSIEVRGSTFVVIGVLSSSEGLELGQSLNDTVLIPLETAKSFTNNTVQLQQISVLLTDKSAENTAIENIKNLLKEKRDNEDDFDVITREQLIAQTDSVFKTLTLFTAAVASISLLVGGIGVMNIMLVTVTERTKEIGIRKAVGATKVQILMQFLTEALVITLFGGIIGILVSVFLGYVISTQTSLSPILDIKLMAVAILVSLVVGIIFGTWPAIRAAQKDPTSSLKHE